MTQSVFISYSRKDERWADAIRDALKNAGMDVYEDKTSLAAGTEWRSELLKALESSTVLVLVSSHAAESRAVQFEAGAALGASDEKSQKVVPVYLSTRGPDYLPLLRGLRGIDLAGLRPEQGGQRVAEYLQTAAA